METKCIHKFQWYGHDTSKCIHCGMVLKDKAAEELMERQCASTHDISRTET